jgi:hypothetical protein
LGAATTVGLETTAAANSPLLASSSLSKGTKRIVMDRSTLLEEHGDRESNILSGSMEIRLIPGFEPIINYLFICNNTVPRYWKT